MESSLLSVELTTEKAGRLREPLAAPIMRAGACSAKPRPVLRPDFGLPKSAAGSSVQRKI